jgi:hypothetical protein
MLHIGFLNIHDLSDHKREDDDFQSYVNTNIVAFAETLNDSPGNLPEFTSLFFTKPTKRKRHGRPGGIQLFIANLVSEEG